MSKTSTPVQGNPAVVGLAGFGLTTLILQFHNIGLCSIGPIIAMGILVGGLAQFIAGFQEYKSGNNFGYSAFVMYGAFWMSLGIMFIISDLGLYKASNTDIAWYMFVWTVYTFIMWFPAMKISAAMALTFTTLLIGFILLTIGHFSNPVFNIIAGYDLIICSLCALYMMASAIYSQVFGKNVLPLGKPWL